jgi:hypothetical protein
MEKEMAQARIIIVDTVALVRALEMGLATLVQFWRVDLHPTPNTTGIRFQASLCQ